MRPFTIFAWYGGKSFYLKNLYPFPKHRRYYEVFLGSGVVYLNKFGRQNAYLNDIYSPLITFFKVCKHDVKSLIKECKKYTKDTREEFTRLQDICEHHSDHEELTVAGAFLALNCYSFSGGNDSYHGRSKRSYQDSKRNRQEAVYLTRIRKLPSVSRRLRNATVRNTDYASFLDTIPDTADSLIYCDPPYYQGGKQYTRMIGMTTTWEDEDFTRLWRKLDAFQHAKIIISIDAHHSEILKGKWNSTRFYRRDTYADKPNAEGKRNLTPEYVIRNWKFKTLLEFV